MFVAWGMALNLYLQGILMSICSVVGTWVEYVKAWRHYWYDLGTLGYRDVSIRLQWAILKTDFAGANPVVWLV